MLLSCTNFYVLMHLYVVSSACQLSQFKCELFCMYSYFLSTVLAIYFRENLLEEMLQQGSLSFLKKSSRFLISSILFRLCLGTKQKSLSKLGRSMPTLTRNCTLAIFSLSSYSLLNQFCQIFYLALYSL